MIPVWILWRVRLKTSQKLGFAAFLCLNVFIIIIAIVKIPGFDYRGKFDNPWIYMWQQVEACVAVTMLSLTAFRSIFVVPPSKKNGKNGSPWIPSTRRLLVRHKKSEIGGHVRLTDISTSPETITGLSGGLHRDSASNSMTDPTYTETSLDEYKSPPEVERSKD